MHAHGGCGGRRDADCQLDHAASGCSPGVVLSSRTCLGQEEELEQEGEESDSDFSDSNDGGGGGETEGAGCEGRVATFSTF